ncbi:30S ribosomal protein S7 [Candidatus Bathyarchaeota archaeon]|nr:30S ribosomal protein S7 [Candidatus Bathyarchaeota archaeon]
MGKKKKKAEKDAPDEEPEEEVEEDSDPTEEGSEESGENEKADTKVTEATEGSDEEAKDDGKDQGLLVFGRWSTNIEIYDKGLIRYLNLKAVGVPHFSGIYTKKRFWKSKYNIIERLANRLMTPGMIKGRVKGRRTSNHSGKKQKVLKIIRRAFELLHLKTDENPVELLVRAIENSAPREDTTRISMGGISYQSSVDVAPQRRLDMALHYIALGTARRSYNTPLTIEECLTEEILAASRGDQNSFAVAKKEEKERIAYSAR